MDLETWCFKMVATERVIEIISNNIIEICLGLGILIKAYRGSLIFQIDKKNIPLLKDNLNKIKVIGKVEGLSAFEEKKESVTKELRIEYLPVDLSEIDEEFEIPEDMLKKNIVNVSYAIIIEGMQNMLKNFCIDFEECFQLTKQANFQADEMIRDRVYSMVFRFDSLITLELGKKIKIRFIEHFKDKRNENVNRSKEKMMYLFIDLYKIYEKSCQAISKKSKYSIEDLKK